MLTGSGAVPALSLLGLIRHLTGVQRAWFTALCGADLAVDGADP